MMEESRTTTHDVPSDIPSGSFAADDGRPPSSSEQNGDDDDPGSSVVGAIFNFTNCIVGAGAIGLGGAMAQSGGLISLLCIAAFGILTKYSLDFVVQLSLTTPGGSSYEELGRVAFGSTGAMLIAVSKFLYSFGCLVAYTVVIKDNMAPALSNLGQSMCHVEEQDSWANKLITAPYCSLVSNNMATTWMVCTTIVLPLCLLRDMRPLASTSALSIASIVAIVGIILFLYVANPHDQIRPTHPQSIYHEWFEIRPGFVECLGTFVFTFVSQHTVHLAFQSLKPSLRRDDRHWKQVSFWSVAIAAVVSMTIGTGVYVSFGQDTQSDIFEIYPQIPLIDVAKLLLSITMVFTFPLPFFTCRELIIINLFPATLSEREGSHDDEEDAETALLNTNHSDLQSNTGHSNDMPISTSLESDLEELLLPERIQQDPSRLVSPIQRHSTITDSSSGEGEEEITSVTPTITSQTMSTPGSASSSIWMRHVHRWLLSRNSYCLLAHDPTQLIWPLHVVITVKLWLVIVALALVAPSLGDVLDLVGCATGTMIAFVVPACISVRLRGWTLLAALLLLVGGSVGLVGTYFSLRQILHDVGMIGGG